MMNGRLAIETSATESFRPHGEAGERGPALNPLATPSVVSSDQGEVRPGAGSRARYVAQRGPGGNGTAYNKMDWMVLDRTAPAGGQLICRTSLSNARLITFALNLALPCS
jgi:hypothetical protein